MLLCASFIEYVSGELKSKHGFLSFIEYIIYISILIITEILSKCVIIFVYKKPWYSEMFNFIYCSQKKCHIPWQYSHAIWKIFKKSLTKLHNPLITAKLVNILILECHREHALYLKLKKVDKLFSMFLLIRHSHYYYLK